MSPNNDVSQTSANDDHLNTFALTDQQRAVVDAIFDFWLEHGAWPSTNRIMLEFRKRGMDADRIISSLPPATNHREDSGVKPETISLKLAGIACCRKGKFITDAVLQLIRLSAQRFIANPTTKGHVSREDLTRLLPEANTKEFLAAEHIVLNEHGWWTSGSGIPSGDWHRDTDVSVVHFANIHSVEEFISLRDRMPRTLQQLESPHVALLREVFERWNDTGQWPDSTEFAISYRAKDDALFLLSEIPKQYYRYDNWLDASHTKRIQLTIDGIAASGGAVESGGAASILEEFIDILQALYSHFAETAGEILASASEVAKRLNTPPDLIQRIGLLFVHEYGSGVMLDPSGQEWVARVKKDILQYEGVQTFHDYRRIRDKIRGTPSAVSQVIIQARTPLTT
jgi:hypothetical protein